MSDYNENFYDTINAGSLKSAGFVVPLVLNLMEANKPKVIDFGCGEGAWLSVFREYGAEVRGVDGPYIDESRLLIPKSHFVPCDLELLMEDYTDRAARGWGTYMSSDLAMSLEVAEHLRPEAADQFVACLCHHADTVLFSAAVPGQGGVGHVNEQWPGYWAEKFVDQGFIVSGALRWLLWEWAPDPVENWYAQNMLIAIRRETFEGRSDAMKALFEGPYSAPLPVIHPVLWDYHRSLRKNLREPKDHVDLDIAYADGHAVWIEE